jgi:hypothetical protein
MLRAVFERLDGRDQLIRSLSVCRLPRVIRTTRQRTMLCRSLASFVSLVLLQRFVK